MVNDKEFSGYGSSPRAEGIFASRDRDVFETIDAVMDAADLLKAWLSIRGMLFATAPHSTEVQRTPVQQISPLTNAALPTPDVHVDPWGVVDVSFSALQRRNLGVERN